MTASPPDILARAEESAAGIRRLEALGARLWPPLDTARVAGWRLGFSRNVTGRANSVVTLGWDGTSVEAAIDAAEAAYRARGLPPRFKLHPATEPADLDERLARRGYALAGRSLVLTADADRLAGEAGDVVLHTDPVPAWVAAAWEDRGGEVPVRVEIASRIPSPRVFALAGIDGADAGAALCGIADGWGMICAVRTRPEFRRQGVAGRLMRGLAAWAHANGASRLFLQVDAANTRARALYDRLGFAVAYPYWTRILA